MGDLASDNSSKTSNQTVNKQNAIQGNNNIAWSGDIGSGTTVHIESADPKLAAQVAGVSAQAVEQAFNLLNANNNRALNTVDSAVQSAQQVAANAVPTSAGDIIGAVNKEILLVASLGIAAYVLIVKRK